MVHPIAPGGAGGRIISSDPTASLASVLFYRGDDYLEIFDEAHSDEEDRFIAIGPIERGLVLVVYTERDAETVRLISARWATRREAELYRRHVRGGAS